MGMMCLALVEVTTPCFAEDFDWSWKGEEKPEAKKPDADPGKEFDWQWEKDKKGDPATQSAAPGVDAAAYNDLVRENLELRKAVAQKERAAAEANTKVSKLDRTQRDLQKRIDTLTKTISEIETEKSGLRQGAVQVQDLEKRLTEAEQARAQLSSLLSAREKELENMRQLQEATPTTAPGVAVDSDLYRQLEKEHSNLKVRLAELEEERQRAVRERDKLQAKDETKAARAETEVAKLSEELKATKSTDDKQKELISKMLERMPQMERELEDLRAKVGGDASVLAAREQELASIREELRRREYRIEKAERMAAVLKQAHNDVQRVSASQQRDMHYNMAVVYAKEGKAKAAEAEYLNALRLDSMDAATHYNLGILYDDELKNKGRAAMHYRRYLKLSPGAPDRDQVREWLMRLDMR